MSFINFIIVELVSNDVIIRFSSIEYILSYSKFVYYWSHQQVRKSLTEVIFSWCLLPMKVSCIEGINQWKFFFWGHHHLSSLLSHHPVKLSSTPNLNPTQISQSQGNNLRNNKTNTPGTRVGPGFRDWTLAVKCRKNTRKSAFIKKEFEI